MVLTSTGFSSSLSEQYRSKDVPPGFTDWHGLHGNSKYYNYTLNENGILKQFGDQEQEYLTDVLVSSTAQVLVALFRTRF